MQVTYAFTDNPSIPAVVTRGVYSTPVWLQQDWEDGEFACYIRGNGCGHCCIAMAANLHGVKIDARQLHGCSLFDLECIQVNGIRVYMEDCELPNELVEDEYEII